MEEKNKQKDQTLISLFYLAFKFLFFLALVFLFIHFASEDESKKENLTPTIGINKGNVLPDYSFKEIGSDEVHKFSDFREKKLLIVFWASWCPYCSETADELELLSKDRKDIVVVGINSQDVEEKEEDVINLLKEKNLSYLNGQLSNEDLEKFQIESFPTILFVDSNGIIQEGVVGGLTKDLIEKKFDSID